MIWNDRLKALRSGSGVSLKDMANLVGVSEATAQRYESGHIHQVPYEVIVAYVEKFGSTPSYIMGWSDFPPVPEDLHLAAPDTPLTPGEQSLIGDYRKLNVTGKDEAGKRVHELTMIPEYKKDTASPGAMESA